MKINQLNERLISFWNDQFARLEEKEMKKEDFLEKTSFHDHTIYLGDHCEKILDFGCGTGYALFYASMFGKKIKQGIGVDTSNSAITYANKTKVKFKLDHIIFKKGDHKTIKDFGNNHFDGIICSNVLDVVPYQTSLEMIETFNYLLKPGGLLLIKVNFYLTDEFIEKLKMKEIAENTYALNGVLRAMNLSAKEWINRFDNYTVLLTDEYQRVDHGPKDRILILKKMK
ncbi:class I SAM-dependent methyltransferase [Mycoplasmatota bacterium]|nr:class I SAM-dependent methyltransferase [Mycoplasmatota bacterium]